MLFVLDTIDLLRASNIDRHLESGVEIVNHPSVGPVLISSVSLSVSASAMDWSIIQAYGSQHISLYFHISSDYVGNIINWNNVLQIEIQQMISQQSLLQLEFANNVQKFQVDLPIPSKEFRRLGIIINSCTRLSVFVDCDLIQSFEVDSSLLVNLFNSQELTIFEGIESNNNTVMVSYSIMPLFFGFA